MNPKQIKSALFLPASNKDYIKKALDSGAHSVVFDLEDAVRQEDKPMARDIVVDLLSERQEKHVMLRINQINTLECLEDLLMLANHQLYVDVIILPKAESGRDITILFDLLSQAGYSADIFAVIETAQGVMNMEEITAHKRLDGVFFGIADLSSDLSVDFDADVINESRHKVVLSAKSHGIAVLDSPSFQIDDMDQVRANITDTLNCGFTGKAAVNPQQAVMINEAYSQSDRLSKAKWIIYRNQNNKGPAIFKRNGELIGPPFIAWSKSIVDQDGMLPPIHKKKR